MLNGESVDGALADGALADGELGMTWKEAMLRVLLRDFPPLSTIELSTIDDPPPTMYPLPASQLLPPLRTAAPVELIHTA
jgi:hypothetical protein